MNIKEAKKQIKQAMHAYLARDEYGNHLIPIYRQRPVFLFGAPGIGKTAIMRQIADELGVGLVSYSMTHHTRQSALGLPFIVKKNYGGVEYDVSEYTMSEIIASVYDQIEETGRTEGILFLDEINCVSETLTPAMLQFLQFKEFGRHRVPEGWIVVTAGNPPEYNRSVREFDIVTWDRLKRIDVEPDYDVWKQYAYKIGVHPSIITYLELKPGDFYKVETGVEGKHFVTARGWDDLSTMMSVCEAQGTPVDELLISQYLQDKKISKDFSIYFELFRKYQEEYRVVDILAGTMSDELKQRIKEASFDERISILGMLVNQINDAMRDTMATDSYVERLHALLAETKLQLTNSKTSLGEELHSLLEKLQRALASDLKAGTIVGERQVTESRVVAFFEERIASIALQEEGAHNFTAVEGAFKAEIDNLGAEVEKTKSQLDNVFAFIEDVFGEGQELTMFVTELSISPDSLSFIGEYGSDRYFKHNKDLLFHDRHKELEAKLAALDIEQ